MMKGARGPETNPAVLEVIQAAQAGTPLLTAWQDAGKPCSRSNIYRAFKSVDARMEAQPSPKPRVSRASEPLLPVPLSKPAKLPYKLTCKQSEQMRVQKAEHWVAFVAAHRKATVAYSHSQATDKTLVRGHRAVDIAAEHSKDLIEAGSKYLITARSLQEWYRQGKTPGAAPKKPGRKSNPGVEALVDVLKSHAKLQQIEGGSMKPAELSTLMKSATVGTPLEPKTQSGAQVRKLLKRTRQGENRLFSRVGESIAQHRSDWLTEGNVAHSFDGWEKFLIAQDFGEWKTHPKTKQRMVYVPEQKRRRVLQCDETHQIMSTELEKGGTRAHVYVDPDLGASGRSSVVNSRHTSGMCAACSHPLSTLALSIMMVLQNLSR
jgi:hypothetical protein